MHALSVLNNNLKRTGIYHSNILILYNNPILMSPMTILMIGQNPMYSLYQLSALSLLILPENSHLFKLTSPYNTIKICH